MVPLSSLARLEPEFPMTQPIAKRFPTPAIASLPDDIRTRLLAVQEKSGFVPNVFLTLAYRPDEVRGFFAYHDALLGIRAKNPLLADQIAVNYRKADITERQRAMLDFAMKVSTEAHGISEADFTEIASHGFSDDDIWDIAAISAFFALSNRLANVTAMRPNDEFYMMGRLPK